MKKFAVSHANFFDNDLTTQIVEAETWHEAALNHPKIAEIFSDENPMSQDQTEAKQQAFDQDALIEIVEIV